MAFLLALVTALILYGTLYPFNFLAGAHPGSVIALLTASLDVRSGRGDILSNVILFLPFGFFAMQAWLARAPRLARLIVVVVAGAALSFGIEYAQTFLPQRTPSLYDVALNTFGTFAGAVAGWVDWRESFAKARAANRPLVIFPFVLLAAWLGYRLFPYVPTLDLQHVKDALKPLFSTGLISLDVLRHFIVTLVIGRLVQAVTTPGRALLAMMLITLGVIAAKPFILTKVILPSETAGVVAGVAVWVVLLSRLSWRTAIVALLLAVQIVIQGVTPFVVRAEPVMISFIPFIGFESGSMSVNLQSFFEKVFLYGALVWLLGASSRSLVFSVTASAALLTAIELVQMFLAGRVSEITDPLLAILLGLALYALDRRDRATRPVGDA